MNGLGIVDQEYGDHLFLSWSSIPAVGLPQSALIGGHTAALVCDLPQHTQWPSNPTVISQQMIKCQKNAQKIF